MGHSLVRMLIGQQIFPCRRSGIAQAANGNRGPALESSDSLLLNIEKFLQIGLRSRPGVAIGPNAIRVLQMGEIRATSYVVPELDRMTNASTVVSLYGDPSPCHSRGDVIALIERKGLCELDTVPSIAQVDEACEQ